MKTLDQVEARTAITNTASHVTISQSGSYYLTRNLTVSSGNAIDIATNGVTLDLNGFTMSSTAASAAGAGILLSSGLKNITIANGFVQGGVTNNGSGVYGGSGFASGIDFSGFAPGNVVISKVSVFGCLSNGIHLDTLSSTVVESCTVQTVGDRGIQASTVKSSSASDCGNYGILCDQVSDSRGYCTGDGYGIGCFGAINCSGRSGGSGTGYGVQGFNLQNCHGDNDGTGYGIYANNSATGCYGFSLHGTGVFAFIANVCHGDTINGTALNATHNVNSF